MWKVNDTKQNEDHTYSTHLFVPAQDLLLADREALMLPACSCCLWFLASPCLPLSLWKFIMCLFTARFLLKSFGHVETFDCCNRGLRHFVFLPCDRVVDSCGPDIAHSLRFFFRAEYDLLWFLCRCVDFGRCDCARTFRFVSLMSVVNPTGLGI